MNGIPGLVCGGCLMGFSAGSDNFWLLLGLGIFMIIIGLIAEVLEVKHANQ